jgi:flagellar hook-associated protein 2
MSGLSTGVGLISGLNFQELVGVIIDAQRGAARRMESRIAGFQNVTKGITALEATVLAIKTSVSRLGSTSTFDSFSVTNSDEAQLSVATKADALPGNYSFQAIREVATHQVLSKGFANTDTQTLGTGTITIATGGRLNAETPLDALNQGEGISRGSIQITDRSGQSATIDLTKAFTVDDVLEAINGADNLDVTAKAISGGLVLTDTSGSTANNLAVLDLNGGSAAQDLGIAQSVASNTLTGSDVYSLSGGFSLAQINDGNALDKNGEAPDLRITFTDDSTLEINLDSAQTVDDVLNLINDDEANAGRVSASLVNGRIELEDLTGGGGTSAFAVEDINNASVVRQLGLDRAAAGTTLTGNRLAAGLNSVLLRNLNGGAGITQTGQVSLTDRTGATATIDLTGAESLDEVLSAINESGLALSAELDDLGTGLRIRDTSGATASNLIIADVGGSTLADDLSIAVDAAVDTVSSGSLKLRHISEASSLSKFAPNGTAVSKGSFVIRDSAGIEATITIGSSATNIGDVIERINAASGISVTAELNEFGDGFVLIDDAGGAGTLEVEELGGDVAADLRLTGESYVGGDGKLRIASRKAIVVDVAAEDTLDDVLDDLKAYTGTVKASIFNDGSAFSPNRLLLESSIQGKAGRLIIDTGGLSLGLSTVTEGQDALLSINSFGSVNFLRASSSNTFTNAAQGLDVTVKEPGEEPAEVTITRDTAAIESALNGFVSTYNTFVSAAAELTKFDLAANQKGVLQGSGTVLRVSDRLDRLVTRRISSSTSSVQSLLDLGIRFDTGGKLTFDLEVFQSAIETDAEAVTDFFLTNNSGFADIADEVLDSLTDTFNGTFAIERKSLENNINTLTTRVEEIDAVLEVRRVRLLQEFIQTESILGTLTSQQQALGTIVPISVNRNK